MAKNLVIVESPAKAKTIGKILGPDFEVKASMGHVRDLPIKKFGVNVAKDFEPEYVVVPGRKELVTGLKKSALECENIYLAPDPDREGEAIAWHLQHLLSRGSRKVKFYRVTYNEITPKAVREAFNNPRDIDTKLVNAQQARRIVDRIVGYRVSPLLWARVKRGLSAGRVQSVALRLICEREKEILAFVPQAYWLLAAKVCKLVAPVDPFLVRLVRMNGEKVDVRSGEEANRILEDLKGRSLRVSSLTTRDISRKAPPPFITSTLQQAMSSRFGMSASATMKLAQRLYEGVDIEGETVGLITYMRTDSFTVSVDAIAAVRGLIGTRFGPEYLPEKPNFYKSRDGSQGAHEAIRPSEVVHTPERLARFLPPGELRLYRVIWERFVASQMAPAAIRQTSAEIAAEPPADKTSTYTFRANSSEVSFPGFMKVVGVVEPVPVDKGTKDETDEVQPLPPLTEGEVLDCVDWLSDRKETQPPARYSEGSLVKELEQNGVGRPSTYAQILSTLIWRRYITKEKRSLLPTPLGIQVNDFLFEALPELFDVQFTATMEAALDKIEDGTVEWAGMVREFYERFVIWIEKAKGPPVDAEKVRSIVKILSQITDWVPGDLTRKKPYSDEKFVGSLREQAEKKEKTISMRQLAALARIGIRYEAQAPGIRDAIVNAGFTEAEWEVASRKPDEQTLRKQRLLDDVQCDEPSKRGRKAYDDRDFIQSLAKRTAEGRDLSPAQKVQLDRLTMKYSAQIPDFDVIKDDLGLAMLSIPLDVECTEILDLMKHVTVWRPESKRGNKTFSDQEFFQSLKNQFERKRVLSPRQKAVLRRVVMAYKQQIPGFDEVAARYAWKAGGKRGQTTDEASPDSQQPTAQ
ncbi:MAG: type I DNA topoisomerase [bacterium]